MGNLTEHYNKLKSDEQERKNRNDYYRDVMNKTPYLIEMHKHNSNSEGYLLDYEKSLALQITLEQQRLFEEAISLISDDKWVTPPVPTIDDIDIVNINNSCKKAQFDYCASGKFRWADGSIHHTPCGCRFEKRYDVKSGFIGSLGNEKRRNKARMECFSEVQEYYHLLQEAASGSQEYVRLSFNGNRDTAYLYKDGSIFARNKYIIEEMSIEDLEQWLCSSICRANRV